MSGRLRRVMRSPTDRGRLGDVGGESSPMLGERQPLMRRMIERGTAEERFRCTPTLRTKCRISGSDKTLPISGSNSGVRAKIFPLPIHVPMPH